MILPEGVPWRELSVAWFEEHADEPLDDDDYWRRMGYDVEAERARDERRR